MKKIIYYTYLIGWSKYDKWYYGVRYSSKSNPNDLWKTYFTSSKYVKKFRYEYGEPDIISIRKTFNCPNKAKIWEEKVLRRLDTRNCLRWLNISQPNSFANSITPWNKGLTKYNNETLLQTSIKISKSKKGKPSGKKGYICSQQEKDNNSWSQIKSKVPFGSYDDFKLAVNKLHLQGLGPYAIARIYNVDGTPIKRIIGNTTGNQSWTKLKINNPNLPFDSYDEFVRYCHQQLSNGRNRWSIKKELNVSEDAVKRALSIKF